MPQSTTDAGASRAAQLHASPRFREGVDAIIGQVRALQAEITEVRPPDSARIESMDDYVKRCESSRGRPPMYRYVGTGFGAGALVELVDGAVKYDLTCGIGPNFFGHGEPELLRVAVEAATSDVVNQGYFQQNADSIEFTEALVGAASESSRLAHAFLCNSGAMANDNALKICFHKHAPADRVIAFKGCFMGRTLAMSQIGDNASFRVGLPITMDVDYMPFYDHVAARRLSAGEQSGQTRTIDNAVRRLEEHLDRYPGKHAAFVFEIVQGEGGYNTAPREFFTALMDVCRERRVAVWVDEIQTFGRTTQMFAFDALGLGEYIDVCTVGKMSQVCAALFSSEYNPKPGLLSGTFLGSSVGLNVGRRMIERLTQGDYYGPSGRIARHHRCFVEGVKALVAKHPEWFPESPDVIDPYGGFGGMLRMTPFAGAKEPIMKTCRALFDEGVITLYCGHGPYHVRMLPPLGVLREDEWPTIFALIENGLAAAAREIL